ncbi:PAS domain-containing hybrid sensor histidine kinase/response regulator [Quatrionicoccus australiensis]|uniref:PAS domain-containing hybrid sensor histidine kinase/response regulator n=1 Tax=Quatrionicoccus australiensis TaxID=138118 RepID=UPI001CF898D5|nr:PAS domain-containing hybrid sensor histidine kinase/response regulator [Quatrionicoccus australiensis]UCV13382.1 PAS domain S-box protein [Quatrionicoccus australiensis]
MRDSSVNTGDASASPMPESSTASQAELSETLHLFESELKKTQQRLAASEIRIHSILETAPVGIGVMTAQRVFVDANPAMSNITGYRKEELIGCSSRLLYPSEKEFERVGGEKDSQLRTYGQCSIEASLRHKNGQMLDVIWSIAPLSPNDPEGLLTVTFQDITKRKQAETQLRLRGAALDAAANAIMITDIGGAIEWANPAFFAMTGYQPVEVLGRNPRELLRSGEQEPEVYLGLWKTIGAGRVWQGRLVNRRRDGSLYHEFQTITPVPDENGIIRNFIAVKEDISQSVQAEIKLANYRDHLEEMVTERTADLLAAQQNAERLARVRSEFLANMSHEIRTPLNAVLGLAQVGLRTSTGASCHENFARIVQAGELLLGIVNDILDFAKIEAGKLTLESAPLNLDSLIERAANLSAERARSKGIDFSISKMPDLPVACLGDELRLLQVLVNLLSNAIKFTLQGAVRLTVYRQETTLNFRISDSGIGMTAEQLSHLFQPFEQAEISTSRRFGGTGLGLVICKHLLDLMGGTISARSTPGKGSEFIVSLPLCEVIQQEPTSVATPLSGLRLRGLRILAAEDNEINRIVLEEILLDEGVELCCVENGVQAVEQVENSDEKAWDIVLMDIMMPIMDGHEATLRIHQIDPGLPVIGLTAHALDEERDKCLASGMLAHVAKPIDLNLLVETIQKLARRASPQITKTAT